jgi:hypothetical protein
MILKPRYKSNELIIMKSLFMRTNLSAKDKKYYLKLEKGYQGEVMFDQYTSKLQNDLYFINDLCIDFNNANFQIDTLTISQSTIFPFEVKNFEGNYLYEKDSFYTLSRDEVQNPLDQLKRSSTLLRQLIKNIGFNLPIEGNVTFINPEFTLYQAPLNKPIIYSTQLSSYMKKLNKLPSKLTSNHRELAETLISMHQNKSPYSRFPTYRYDQMQKGIICPESNSFLICKDDKKLVCVDCGYEEELETGILRSVEELRLLFPELKITTTLIHEWCNVIHSKKLLRRILMENLIATGYGRWLIFE